MNVLDFVCLILSWASYFFFQFLSFILFTTSTIFLIICLASSHFGVYFYVSLICVVFFLLLISVLAIIGGIFYICKVPIKTVIVKEGWTKDNFLNYLKEVKDGKRNKAEKKVSYKCYHHELSSESSKTVVTLRGTHVFSNIYVSSLDVKFDSSTLNLDEYKYWKVNFVFNFIENEEVKKEIEDQMNEMKRRKTDEHISFHNYKDWRMKEIDQKIMFSTDGNFPKVFKQGLRKSCVIWSFLCCCFVFPIAIDSLFRKITIKIDVNLKVVSSNDKVML